MLTQGGALVTLLILVTYQCVKLTAAEVCPAGFFCIGNSHRQCPAGHYCPAGSTSPVSCPLGTYRHEVKGQSMTDCTICPAGMYCDATGLAAPSGNCDAGYYCVEGSTSPHPESQGQCPAGHYCPAGSTSPMACPLGTYRHEVKGQSMTDCTICPGGMYCDVTGLAAPSGNCDAGYYCVEGSTSPHPESQGQCPAGHYCPAGSTSPMACPLGTYRREVRGQSMTDCSICPAGMYCDVTGLAAPSGNCDAGYYCVEGSTSPHPDGSDFTGGICPAGYYCPAGSAMPMPCTFGTYNEMAGQSSCSVCPPGHFCPTVGATGPTECQAGYYSDVAGQTTCILCPVGHYCPAGSISPTQCPSTSSCTLTGMSSPKR